jgi:hypothetical protein
VCCIEAVNHQHAEHSESGVMRHFGAALKSSLVPEKIPCIKGVPNTIFLVVFNLERRHGLHQK